MASNTKQKPVFIKVVYFDEIAAQDYIDVANGGRLDWSTDENQEKLAKMLIQIETQAKGGFNILEMIKGSLSGNASAGLSTDVTRIFDSTLKNTLLTDYIEEASTDKNIKKFDANGVYAPENSVSLYKMYSSYLSIVPKEQMPFDMEKLNDALLGERGYYEMLLLNEKEPTCVLRFNIKAFKNNYNLADLSKMKLSYYGVKVGLCTKEQLSIQKEFSFANNEETPTAETILDGTDSNIVNKQLEVYDIVLAGVLSE